MKFPSLWIVAGFAAGIFLATPRPVSPLVWVTLAAAALGVGFLFYARGWLRPAWAVGLVAWFFLGAAAARLEQVSRPINLASDLIQTGRIDASEPLRWQGRLREDPVRLPWGLRYDIDLEDLDAAGQQIPAAGGLRVSYFSNPDAPESAPLLRAGNRVEVLVRARLPHNYGNPGAFDFRGYLAREGIHLIGTLRSFALLRKLGEPPPTLSQRFARVRGRLLDRVDVMFATAPDRGAVVRAMLLGDRSFIDHSLSEPFQKTGTFHVLVIAGLHVGALAAFLYWLGRRLRLSLPVITLVALTVLAAYVAVVENRPPILRAGLMAAIYLCARLLFRRGQLLNSVALAAVVLLGARPSSLFDPSFQLSFLAVGTIGALAAPWIQHTSEPYRRALEHLGDVTRDPVHRPRVAQFRLELRAGANWLARRLPGRFAGQAEHFFVLPCAGALRLWDLFVLSFALQVGMLPPLAHYFHRVSLAGPIVNIPAVLLTGLIVPVGFLTLGASLVWAALGQVLARVLGPLVAALASSVGWFAGARGTSFRVPGPPPWLVAAFFAAMILLAVAARAWTRRWQLLAAAPLVALGIGAALYPLSPHLQRGMMEVTVLDVGQGDAIFTAFPDGRTMLMDGGGIIGWHRAGGVRTGTDIGEEVVSPYLWSRGLKRLDVVALSHAHQDHIGGLRAVVANFRVGELWVGRDVASSEYRALLAEARAQGVRIVHRVRGDSFTWSDVSGRVLWPDTSAETPTAKNDDSLLLRLTQGRMVWLLPGDIEGPVERRVLAEGDAIGAEFLKVAHHGSKTSTTQGFLDAVHPEVAAISVGENNPFGHPAPEVLERLRDTGIPFYRTDRDGAVTALSDGQTLTVRSFAQARRYEFRAEAGRFPAR